MDHFRGELVLIAIVWTCRMASDDIAESSQRNILDHNVYRIRPLATSIASTIWTSRTQARLGAAEATTTGKIIFVML